MKLTKILLVMVAVLVLGGCGKSAYGGAQASSTPTPHRGSASSAQVEQESADYSDGGEGYPGNPAPSEPAGEMQDYDAKSSSPAPAAEVSGSRPPPRPRSRPGLGTVWGENRSSHVTSAPFYRADPNRPFATVGIHYNDAEGVQAMAEHSGRSNWGDNVFPAAERQLSVRILDGNYNPLPGTRSGGRTYVVGEAGQRYVVRIQNHTGNRVEVVATVDGLDVLDGRPGNFRKRGYIVQPWGTLDVEGFRRSGSTVAAFRFGSVRDSYAARKGKGRNVGVIGVAFFHETGSRWPWTDQEIRRRHDADPFPGRYADPPPAW